jgi:hypothetical protein
MSSDPWSGQAEAWAPDDVEALFDAARGARVRALRTLEVCADTMRRRRVAHTRYLRTMAMLRRVDPQSG